MIEIDRWPRLKEPLASHIEVFRRKIEMRVLNRYYFYIYSSRHQPLYIHLLGNADSVRYNGWYSNP